SSRSSASSQPDSLSYTSGFGCRSEPPSAVSPSASGANLRVVAARIRNPIPTASTTTPSVERPRCASSVPSSANPSIVRTTPHPRTRNHHPRLRPTPCSNSCPLFVSRNAVSSCADPNFWMICAGGGPGANHPEIQFLRRPEFLDDLRPGLRLRLNRGLVPPAIQPDDQHRRREYDEGSAHRLEKSKELSLAAKHVRPPLVQTPITSPASNNALRTSKVNSSPPHTGKYYQLTNG